MNTLQKLANIFLIIGWVIYIIELINDKVNWFSSIFFIISLIISITFIIKQLKQKYGNK